MVRDPRGSTHARVRHRPAPPVSSTPRLRPSSRRLTAPLFRLRSTQNQILDAAAIDSSVHGKSPGRQVKGARPNPKPVAELYHFGQTIGRGGFAEVRRATHKVHGTDYAMKIIKLPKTGQRALKEEIFYEIGLLANMDSPYIVKLHEFFVESDRIIMVTELLEGGDLFDAVVACGHYDEHMAKRIFRRILLGVRYLHEVGVTHCDLKLENLLLASETDLDSVKICDLGLAKKASARSRFLPSGTPEYISPEVLEANMAGADQGAGQSGENGSKSVPQAHGPSVDNWACGVLLFVLLAGYTPFAHEDEHAMYELIRTGNFNFTQSPVWENVSRDAKDLIEKFLTVDESQRMTAERALATHPWLVERAPNAVAATNGSGWEATPMTPRVHLESVQKNLKKERDTGKLFGGGAVNAVIAMNRVAQGVSGKCPNTYARRKSVGSQQRAPVLAGQPSQSPEKVRAIARIPSKDKMDELAEVDSDDERDWSVRGGVRRGRSQTPSLSRSSSRARLSRSSSRDLSLSRHASRESYPARSAGKSPYSGNRSNRGSGTASPVLQSPRVSNEWIDDDARSDGEATGPGARRATTPSPPPRSVGKVRSGDGGGTPSPRRSVGKVRRDRRGAGWRWCRRRRLRRDGPSGRFNRRERAGGDGSDENEPREAKPDAGDGAAGPLAGVAQRQGGAIAAFAVAEVGVARARRRRDAARGGTGHRERLGTYAGRDRGARPRRRGAVWKRDVVGGIGRRGRGAVAGELAAGEGAHAEVQARKDQRGVHRVITSPSFINTNERRQS